MARAADVLFPGAFVASAENFSLWQMVTPTSGTITVGSTSIRWDNFFYNFQATLDTIVYYYNASLVAVAVNSTTSNATPALDATKTDTVLTAQSAAITAWSLSGTFVHGQKHMIQIKDNGTTRAITWTSSVIVAADNITLPTATTVGKTHLIGARYDSVVGKLIAIAVGSY